ncbi:MAG TPA: hypothetical protein VE593_08600 [Nitrososphaeraceae archaeon]|nr:hypothetical protein [Nitrososphaeraceae archaeon]
MANSDQQLIILVKHVLGIHLYATVMSTNRAVNTIMSNISPETRSLCCTWEQNTDREARIKTTRNQLGKND